MLSPEKSQLVQKRIHMSNKILLAIITLIVSSNIANAQFTATYSVNSPTIKKIEEWVDKDTLVFIEIDDTLMMPQSLMFSFDSNPYIANPYRIIP